MKNAAQRLLESDDDITNDEIDNILGRERGRTRTDWTGPRNTSPVLFVENYQVTWPPRVYIRWRQTF